MSGPNGTGPVGVPTPVVEEPVVKITITLNRKGEVHVNGPLDNLALMYGMLESAKDVARNEATRLAAQLIKPATAGEIALVKQ